MLYELRIYSPNPGKHADLHARFANHTLKLWDSHGIRQVGFWTVAIGEANNDLYYILEWESLAEREKKWAAFMTDPVWVETKRVSELAGPILAKITNLMLTPTAYSKMK